MDNFNDVNSQRILDAAAYLFWSLAERIGVEETNRAVRDSAGRCLLEQSFTPAILGRYGYEKISAHYKQQFADAIAFLANKAAISDSNLLGMIYAEDAPSGRSPTAADIDTGSLRAIPREILIKGPAIEKLGKLCLRHPLPAVVFSETMPHAPLVEVASTRDALGFEIPMFLTSVVGWKVTDAIFALSGIFYIPVPSLRHGDLWNRAILNSMRLFRQMSFISERGSTVMDIQW